MTLKKILDWKWGPPSEPRVIRESPAPDLRNRPTVWVLGAGCSRNYTGAAVLQENYPNIKPPLQTDFFQMVAIVAQFVNRHLNQHAESPFCHLIYSLERLYPSSGWNYFAEFWEGDPSKLIARDSPNLEDILTLVDLSVEAGWPTFGVFPFSKLGGIAEGAYFNPFHALDESGFFSGDRLRLLNLMVLTLIVSMGGTECAFHERLAGLIKPGDTVLTFNYDTLIDEALFESGKLTHSAYGVDFAGVIKEMTPGEDHSFGKAHYGILADYQESPVQLLKLHGSLNWVKCPVCDSSYLDVGTEGMAFMIRLRRYFEWLIKHLANSDKNPRVADWLREVDPVVLHFECPRCGGRPLQRVIIPPTLHKSFTKNIFQLQWYRAAKSLAPGIQGKAKEDYDLIVIGYSLPQTDYFSRLLFSLSREPRSITLVSPTNDRVGVFQSAFGGLVLPRHVHPDEFFESL